MSENPSDTQDQHKESVTQRLKDKSLKAAGWSYVVGDVALALAKHMEDDKHGLSGAAIWLAGGAAAGIFGNPKAEKQLQLFERRLGAHLRKQGVQIPPNPTTQHLVEDGGVISHIESFLYKHPSELLNAAYAIGGALTLKGGLCKKTPMDQLSGALIVAGALSGLLIKEKKPDPDHPAQGMAGKAWEWVKEKPLRVSGAFYLANNIPLVAESINKHRQGSASCVPRYITAASYIFANVMLTLSSKDNINAKDAQKNQKILERLAYKSAIVIAAQPKEAQEALIQNTAEYLSKQPGIKKSAAEIADAMHEKLAAMQREVPAFTTNWQQKVEKSLDSGLSPSFT